MRVGINGMGRMGRLALRAAFGGVSRAEGDPRAGNRLDVVHVNEIKGGAAATAHLLEFDSIHGRWRTSFEVDGERAIVVGGKRIGFSAAASPGEVQWGDLGCDIVLECTGRFLKPDQLQAYFDRGVRRVIVAAPVKDAAALNIVVGVNDHLYDPARHKLITAASCTTNCLAPVVKVVHEGDRHPPRPDHDDPRSDQHQRRRRCAAQGPAARALGHALAAADDHGQRHGDRAHLSRARGQAQRPCGARAGAQRQPHRLRVRAEAGNDRAAGERAVRRRRARTAWPASSATRRGRWCRPTTTTTRAARSSTRRAPW